MGTTARLRSVATWGCSLLLSRFLHRRRRVLEAPAGAASPGPRVEVGLIFTAIGIARQLKGMNVCPFCKDEGRMKTAVYISKALPQKRQCATLGDGAPKS